MNSAKEIAQWVIDNRYPRSENEKVSDLEMYHELIVSIEKLCISSRGNIENITCETCISKNCSTYFEPCKSCDDHSNYEK